MPRTSLLTITFLALSFSRAAAEFVELPPIADNTLYFSPTGHLSNGAGDFFFTGTTSFVEARRGLVRFDIAGAIPAGATITDVTLSLHMSRTSAAAEITSLHPLLASWGEGASDAPGEEGTGAPAQPGDATWLHTGFNTHFWAAPGGDFDPTPSAAIPVIGVAYYDWTATPLLLDDVQGWLDQPATNHGWLLMGNEANGGSAKRFDSREHPDPTVRPILTIGYEPIPEPGTLALCLIPLSALCRRTRQSLRQ